MTTTRLNMAFLFVLIGGLLVFIVLLPNHRQELAARSDEAKSPLPVSVQAIAAPVFSETGRSSTEPSTFEATIDIVWSSQGPPPSTATSMKLLLWAAQNDDYVGLPISSLRWSGGLPLDAYHVNAASSREGALRTSTVDVITSNHPHATVTITDSSNWELAVTDAADGSHMSGVELYCLSSATDSAYSLYAENHDAAPPAEALLIPCSGTSPFSIASAPDHGAWFWVRAPGHAWASFVRSVRQSRVHVALLRSGALDVRISEASHGKQTIERGPPIAISILGPSGNAIEFATGGSEHRSIEDLPAGDYTIRAKTMPSDLGFILAEERQYVAAGTRASVTLAPAWPVKGTSIGVTVALPAGPKYTEPAFVLYKRHGSSWRFVCRESVFSWAETVPDRVYAKSYERIASGTYLGQVEPIGGQFLIEAEPEKHTEAVLELADAVDIELRLTTEDNTTIKDAWIRRVYEDDAAPDQVGDVVYLPGIRLPSRMVSMSVQAFSEGAATEKVVVHPGSIAAGAVIELQLHTKAFGALRVSAWENQGISWMRPEDWNDFSLRPIGHSGRLLRKEFGRYGTAARLTKSIIAPDYGECAFVVDQVGWYELTRSGHPVQKLRIEGLTDYSMYKATGPIGTSNGHW